MGNVLSFLLFVLPLGVDTFAIAAAVGASRPSGPTRWRISAIFVTFEGGMPLVGLTLGASLGHTVGSAADYLSGDLLIILGSYLWWADSDDDDDEGAKARRLTSARGLALVGLALSVSLDELAIGFSLGLGADLTTPATIVAVIALQTLVVSQLGLSFGGRISERLRECIELLAGPMLIVLGVYLLAEALIRIGLVTAREAVVIGILILALGAVTSYRRHAARTHASPPMRAGHGRHRATVGSSSRRRLQATAPPR
jgi:manganese efflux pump family protein